MKRAIAYTRVSTDKQVKTGVSLDAQASKITAMAEVQDAQIIETIEDGESGKSLDRPGMQRILEMAKRRQIDMVIIYKLDRLTRSVVDLDKIVKSFNKYGVALVSVNEHIDTGSASGRVVINLLTVISQWERETIGERTAFALRHKRDTRKMFNHEPFGFRRINFKLNDKGKPVGGDLDPIEGEMTVAYKILDMHDKRLSLRAIATRLNKLRAIAKNGGQWVHTSVAKVIKNRDLYETTKN